MKRFLLVFALFAAMVQIISCGEDNKSKNATGTLGGECYGNRSCNDGLLCDEESNTCIEDPENPGNDSDASLEQTDDNADTSSEQNDEDSGDTNPDNTDSTPNNDADSGDSAPDSDNGDTTNENPSNLPECSPTSATPCVDPETDLIWSEKSTEKMPWADAVNYCKDMNEGGFSDWRLPSKAVLGSLVQNCDNSSGCKGDTDGKYSKLGDIVFLWSSTGGSSEASGIYFFNGATQSKSVDENFNVRCVRNLKCDEPLFNPTLKKCVNPCDTEPCDSSANITNGTCVPYNYEQYSCGGKDPSSGLTWSAKAQKSMNWDDAGTYCDGLSEGGYSDWRLPNISELRTLIQNCSGTQMPGGSCGVIDTGNSSTSCLSTSCQGEDCYSCSSDSTGGHSKFGETEHFWSSSTVSANTDYAWGVGFYDGDVGNGYKVIDIYVRCVR